MEKTIQLEDKRKVLGEIIVCGTGCCCGHTELGAPPVPVDWIMSEWKRRKLLVGVDISISGCLGPCLTNTICIMYPTGSTWLGELSDQEHYQALLDWAEASSVADVLLPLPDSLRPFEFERFRNRAVSPTALFVQNTGTAETVENPETATAFGSCGGSCCK